MKNKKLSVSLILILFSLVLINTGCDILFLPYADFAIEEYDGSLQWTREVQDAAWSRRWDHAAAVYDDKLWVIGGYDSTQRGSRDSYMEDVWFSADGISWVLAEDDAPWLGRRGHAAVSLNGFLYVVGGFSVDESTGARAYTNDVWRTNDGVSWTCVQASAEWTARMNHTLLVSGNKMYLIGGFSGQASTDDPSSNYLGDVWESSDGITWVEITHETAFGKRAAMAGTVDDTGKILLQGGYYPQSIFSDLGRPDPNIEGWLRLWCGIPQVPDGINWASGSKQADLTDRRAEHQMVYFTQKIWLFAGKSNTSSRFSEQHEHYSTEVFDSALQTWETDSLGCGFGPRYGYTALVFDPGDGSGERIWVLGGIGNDGLMHDVWSAVPGENGI